YQDVTNALDQFKQQLGVPVNLPLLLDDAPARPITRQLDRYYEVLADADAAGKLLDQQEDLPAAKLRPFLLRVLTTDPLVRGTESGKNLPPAWDAGAGASTKELKARLDRLGEERRRLLNLKTDLETQGKTLSPADARRLREGEFESDLGGLEQILRVY